MRKSLYLGIFTLVLSGCGSASAAAKVNSSIRTTSVLPTTTIPVSTTTTHSTVGTTATIKPILTAPTTTQRQTTVTTSPQSSPNPTTPITNTHAVFRTQLDPSFTQNPSNPLDVTYSFSANVSSGTLPDGVLELFNNGSLACSINVGGSTVGGTCPVVYDSELPASETITVTYVSGTASATSTSTITITPYSTTTTQTVSTNAGSITDSISVIDQMGNVPPLTSPLNYYPSIGFVITDSTTGTHYYYNGQRGSTSCSFAVVNGNQLKSSDCFNEFPLPTVNPADAFTIEAFYGELSTGGGNGVGYLAPYGYSSSVSSAANIKF